MSAHELNLNRKLVKQQESDTKHTSCLTKYDSNNYSNNKTHFEVN